MSPADGSGGPGCGKAAPGGPGATVGPAASRERRGGAENRLRVCRERRAGFIA